jgi:hypothetical protein
MNKIPRHLIGQTGLAILFSERIKYRVLENGEVPTVALEMYTMLTTPFQIQLNLTQPDVIGTNL